MLFAKFKRLSPAAKVVASAASFLSSLAGVAAIYIAIHPLTNCNPDLVGRWDSDYTYPITDGVLHFKGHTSVFHEGKYNVSGVITLEGKIQDQGYKLSYDVVGAGNWTADTKRMSITLQDMHSSTKTLQIGGIDINPVLIEKLSGRPSPQLSDVYPNGMSDEYLLDSVSHETVVLQATDPFGKPFSIEMHRQS